MRASIELASLELSTQSFKLAQSFRIIFIFVYAADMCGDLLACDI